jgi:hypothetical protein
VGRSTRSFAHGHEDARAGDPTGLTDSKTRPAKASWTTSLRTQDAGRACGFATEHECSRSAHSHALERGAEIVQRNPGVESEIVAFALAAFGAGQAGDLDELLKVNLPPLFQQFPDGSMWQITVSDVLLARFAFARAQLAFQMTPDLPLGEEMEQLRAFSDLSLTSGIDVSAVIKLPLLALSPAVLGFLVPAMPHVLVFCFGTGVDLRRPYPTSFSALYRPTVLDDAEDLDRSAFVAHSDPTDGPRLLAWWVGQLNSLYSHIADPTRFTDARAITTPQLRPPG